MEAKTMKKIRTKLTALAVTAVMLLTFSQFTSANAAEPNESEMEET
jgi:hypothetical protein